MKTVLIPTSMFMFFGSCFVGLTTLSTQRLAAVCRRRGVALVFGSGAVTGSTYQFVRGNPNEWEKTKLGVTRSAGVSLSIDCSGYSARRRFLRTRFRVKLRSFLSVGTETGTPAQEDDVKPFLQRRATAHFVPLSSMHDIKSCALSRRKPQTLITSWSFTMPLSKPMNSITFCAAAVFPSTCRRAEQSYDPVLTTFHPVDEGTVIDGLVLSWILLGRSSLVTHIKCAVFPSIVYGG